MMFRKFTALALLATTATAFVAGPVRSSAGGMVQVQQQPRQTTVSSTTMMPPAMTTSSPTKLFMGMFDSKTMPQDVSEGQVRSLFYLWNDALATGDSRIVAKRYSSDAMLLPTVSDTPRTDYESIKDYFDNFLKLKPQGIILSGQVKVGKCGTYCTDTGIYEFTMGATGAKVKARYSYVYTYEDNQWKIAHHHSSVMPEGSKVEPKVSITEEQVKNLFLLWNTALDTLDSDCVAQRYAKNAVLLPTVSDTPRTDYASIKSYFDAFLKLKPQGVVLDSFVTIGKEFCEDCGVYEFTMGATGQKVKARYSFVYVEEDGKWKIQHHHSSAMPETSKGPKISEAEVGKLFYLWNDALATLDSDTVARRYSKGGVLLPTVSDTPRTNYASIKDYFDAFLLKKPQGVIMESFCTVGEGWCKDVGTYEFTMGNDGSKVKARYSFVYVYEDGEWKISHHHSSVMPEAMLAAAAKGNAIAERETVMG